MILIRDSVSIGSLKTKNLKKKVFQLKDYYSSSSLNNDCRVRFGTFGYTGLLNEDPDDDGCDVLRGNYL